MYCNLNALNPRQHEAVTCQDKNLLILAGAGSGKTRVITYRIAYLINQLNVDPSSVLGLTFTNKAAGEMKERVKAMTGTSLPGLFMGTFHSYALRKLRRYIDLLGYNRRFVIYDEGDVTGLIRRIARDEFPGKNIPASKTAARISLCKNSMMSIRQSFERFPQELFPRVYREYCHTMKQLNALDFDDLLIRLNELLVRFPQVRSEIQEDLSHILVDEFQDTNDLQLFMLKKIYHPDCSICVVGDDDQSIYAWRGAQVRHILEFERFFGNVKTIRLEQNYRSTENILNAAHGIISRNPQRSPKKLWTSQGKGAALNIYPAGDADDEVTFVSGEVASLIRNEGIPPEKIAVLYRSNNQSRHFEAALRKKRIPYRVLGGKELFDRAEVKDVLTYLKLFLNPHDDNSLLRIINVPQRSVGKQTVEKLRNASRVHNKSIFTIIRQAETFLDSDVSSSTLSALNTFRHFTEKYRKIFNNSNRDPNIFSGFLNELGYYDYLVKMYGKKDNTSEVEKRYENILALSKVYEDYLNESNAPDLSDFISTLSIDNLLNRKESKKERDIPAVTLLTIHSAKGLEFDVVFLVGFEEGLLPHKNALDNNNIHEERRLCYVAFTRAGTRLYLSYAKNRKLYGKPRKCFVSSFFDDIPEECLKYSMTGENEKPISLTDAWDKMTTGQNE